MALAWAVFPKVGPVGLGAKDHGHFGLAMRLGYKKLESHRGAVCTEKAGLQEEAGGGHGGNMQKEPGTSWSGSSSLATPLSEADAAFRRVPSLPDKLEWVYVT